MTQQYPVLTYLFIFKVYGCILKWVRRTQLKLDLIVFLKFIFAFHQNENNDLKWKRSWKQ